MKIDFKKTTEIPKSEAKKILEQVDFNNDFFKKYWGANDLEDELADKFFLDELEKEFIEKGYSLSRDNKYSILKISSPQKAQLKVYSCFPRWRESGGLVGIFSKKYNLPPTSAFTTGHIIFEEKRENPEKVKSILENLNYWVNITTDEQEESAREEAKLKRIIKEAIEESKPIEIADMYDY